MCHAGCSGRNKGSVGDGCGGVIIEGSGVSSVWSADGNVAAGDGKASVGIDAVAGCLKVQGTTGDGYAAVGRTHSAECTTAESATELVIKTAAEVAVRTILHVAVGYNVRRKIFRTIREIRKISFDFSGAIATVIRSCVRSKFFVCARYGK